MKLWNKQEEKVFRRADRKGVESLRRKKVLASLLKGTLELTTNQLNILDCLISIIREQQKMQQKNFFQLEDDFLPLVRDDKVWNVIVKLAKIEDTAFYRKPELFKEVKVRARCLAFLYSTEEERERVLSLIKGDNNA